VTRVDPHSICVRTKRFSMQIEVLFDGFATVLPRHFEKLYLDRGFRDVQPYQISLVVNVRFRLRSLFTPSGWEYYRWLDSFLDGIAHAFSFERFLQDVGWETAVSAAIVTRRLFGSSDGVTDIPKTALTQEGENRR